MTRVAILQVEIALKELRTPIRFTPRTQSAKDALAPMPLQEAAIQSLMVHTNIASIFWAGAALSKSFHFSFFQFLLLFTFH